MKLPTQSNTKRPRQTKIVATLGPNSSDSKTLRAMLKAGMNVARINFSHGDHDSNGALITAVREASKATKLPVAILQDLCGPKIRIGMFETELVKLKPRKQITLTTKACVGTVERVSVNYKKLPKEVTPGTPILLNDGKVLLKVVSTTDTDILCDIIIGGTIRGRRGVNVPGAMLSINAITPKDKRDLAYGLSVGVNFVTLSFVRQAKEIEQLRRLLGTQRDSVGVIAKIETQEAIDNLDEIITAADGVMVARGDLAIEIPRESVPLVQKEIIRKCNELGKPVITATQMLDSMREQPVPTRAEVNDVANAILDGTDAIMLSDETTVGRYPVGAVTTMHDIASTIEATHQGLRTHNSAVTHESDIAASITRSIAEEANRLSVQAIVVLSETGSAARLVARHRPKQPILVITPNERTYYQALLIHGCIPALVETGPGTVDEARDIAQQLVMTHKLARKGESYILGAGIPFGQKGSTNLLLVEHL